MRTTASIEREVARAIFRKVQSRDFLGEAKRPSKLWSRLSPAVQESFIETARVAMRTYDRVRGA